jgi:2',3'-cyclic-nucleotide 2'-phosphodiesterase (5'-nucleotidase family)
MYTHTRTRTFTYVHAHSLTHFPQVVILLSHVGYTADIAAAELIPGIDAVVGG